MDYELKEEYGIQRVLVVKYVSRLRVVFCIQLTFDSTYSYFSQRIFTETLLPLLKKTETMEGSDVRIVNVSRNPIIFIKKKIKNLMSECLKMSSDAHTFVPKDTRFQKAEDFNKSWKERFAGSMGRYGMLACLGTLNTSRCR